MNDQQKLRKCFINALGIPAGEDFSQMSLGTASWDSVAHIALVTEMESAFGVELTPEDITDLTSYGKAEHILSRHGIALTA